VKSASEYFCQRQAGKAINSVSLYDVFTMKEFFKKYHPYFVDIWQYLIIIVIMIIAAIFIL